MDYKIVLLPQAENDITEAFGYLWEHSPEAATRWYKRVRDAINTLSKLPARCAHAPEAAKLQFELRQLLYGKHPGIYRIVFRIVDDREVHVLSVRHCARKSLTKEEVRLYMDL